MAIMASSFMREYRRSRNNEKTVFAPRCPIPHPTSLAFTGLQVPQQIRSDSHSLARHLLLGYMVSV